VGKGIGREPETVEGTSGGRGALREGSSPNLNERIGPKKPSFLTGKTARRPVEGLPIMTIKFSDGRAAKRIDRERRLTRSNAVKKRWRFATPVPTVDDTHQKVSRK
jgi:hypothetical protein